MLDELEELFKAQLLQGRRFADRVPLISGRARWPTAGNLQLLRLRGLR